MDEIVEALSFISVGVWVCEVEVPEGMVWVATVKNLSRQIWVRFYHNAEPRLEQVIMDWCLSRERWTQHKAR